MEKAIEMVERIAARTLVVMIAFRSCIGRAMMSM
jgi:hypothetical protein